MKPINISYNGFPDLNTGGISMFEGLFSNMNLILDVIVSILQIMVFGLLFLLIFDSIYDSIHKRHIKVRETAAAKAVADAAGPAAEEHVIEIRRSCPGVFFPGLFSCARRNMFRI